jgi:hypothetical protein
MRIHFILFISFLLPPFAATQAQLGFTNASALMSGTTNSGGCMGVADMNGDGLDDLCRLHLSKVFQVDYQSPDGTFSLVDYGPVSESNQWGMAIGDLARDGHKDLVSGGQYDGVHHLRIAAMGQHTLGDLPNDEIFMQCMNMADMNNDGHADVFACHDHAAPKEWLNDGNGNLLYADVIDHTTTPPSDMSGNYGSVWTDFDNDGDLDLYIAKCRQGVVDLEDPRRWNRLFVNDGNGNFTDMAVQHGVQSKYQSWTADFGDIDNDGDFDLVITNHDHTIQLFENDGTGHFTEITDNSGLGITGFFLQSKFVDFDNDGFVDLILSGGIERFFRNNGNKTFTQITGLFPSPKAMHSFATGDLNNDGFIDVYAGYGSNYVTPDLSNPDRLWLNNGNDNHWLMVRLQGTQSNPDAIGARVTLTGPWGTQIREVRSGESYGIVTTFGCHFGLGTHTTIPTMTVRWPSGLTEVFTDVAVDQVINIIEGVCIAPQAAIASPSGTVLCTGGDPLPLVANEGYFYQWSTGSQEQTVIVNAPGTYSVTIDDGTGCSASTSVVVRLDPDETPMVQVDGPQALCEGGTVTLSAITTHPPLWSTGATSETIEVTTTGSYHVTVEGMCGSHSSAPVLIEVLDIPDAPEAAGTTVLAGTSATLTASGEGITWYGQAEGGTALATGNEFTTPPLANTTSYWVASANVQEEEIVNGGKPTQSTTGGYQNNANFYLLFHTFEPMTIHSVKVIANGAGPRTIGVVDQISGQILQSGTFMIPDVFLGGSPATHNSGATSLAATRPSPTRLVTSARSPAPPPPARWRHSTITSSMTGAFRGPPWHARANAWRWWSR